jgi:hypothetical protein
METSGMVFNVAKRPDAAFGLRHYAVWRGRRYNAGMDTPIFRFGPQRPMMAAALAFAVAIVALASSSPANAQTPQPSPAAAPANPAPSRETLAWTFDGAQAAAGGGWTAERGTLTVANGEARLRPDANRRVVLLSPPDLPDTARAAEAFLLGTAGTGLQRVRIQGRRDARGGWITIADASGSALHETAEGYLVKRKPGARDVPIERLRIELQFRTTNPRTLQRIAVH